MATSSLVSSPGKAVCLARILRPAGSFIVPMDHTLTVGAFASGRSIPQVARTLAGAGADAIVVHKGRVRSIEPVVFERLALIVHLSGGTVWQRDSTSKVLVGSVAESVALGADAVSVHVNVGSPSEPQQLADLGKVARQCERWGMPLLAMMYVRGPGVGDQQTAPSTLLHLAAIAADLGADLVKLAYPGCPIAMAEVVECSAIPVVVAGGEAVDHAHACTLARAVMNAGAAGLSFGRAVFEAEDPVTTARALAVIAHETRRPALDLTTERVEALATAR